MSGFLYEPCLHIGPSQPPLASLLLLVDDQLQLLVLLLLLIRCSLFHQSLQGFVEPLLCLSSLKILTKGLEVVLLPLELRGGVDLGGAHLLDGHLHVVHPLHHLLVSCVIDLLDEGVVLLPEGHGGDVGVVLVSAWPALPC